MISEPTSISAPDLESPAELIGTEELAGIFKLSDHRVRCRLRAAGLAPHGTVPPPPGGKKLRYGYDKAAAVEILRQPARGPGRPRGERPAKPTPAKKPKRGPAVPIDAETWTPPPSAAVERFSSERPYADVCPFAQIPCKLARTCSAEELRADRRGPGRFAAAEMCLNNTVPATSSATRAPTCLRCGKIGTADCAFDCFRVAHSPFISDAFGTSRNRHSATKTESFPCTT